MSPYEGKYEVDKGEKEVKSRGEKGGGEADGREERRTASLRVSYQREIYLERGRQAHPQEEHRERPAGKHRQPRAKLDPSQHACAAATLRRQSAYGLTEIPKGEAEYDEGKEAGKVGGTAAKLLGAANAGAVQLLQEEICIGPCERSLSVHIRSTPRRLRTCHGKVCPRYSQHPLARRRSLT